MSNTIKGILVAIIVLTSSTAISQKHFIKTDVLSPFLSNPFSISYETNWGSPSSLVFQAEGGWYKRDKTSKDGQPYWTKRITGFGGSAEWRYYLRSSSHMSKPVGIFTGVYARAIQLSYLHDFSPYAEREYEETDITGKTLAVGGGPLLGYKFKRPYSKFYFEFLGGFAWGLANLEEYTTDDLPDQHFLWRLEFSVGYAFQ